MQCPSKRKPGWPCWNQALAAWDKGPFESDPSRTLFILPPLEGGGQGASAQRAGEHCEREAAWMDSVCYADGRSISLLLYLHTFQFQADGHPNTDAVELSPSHRADRGTMMFPALTDSC